MNAENAGAEAFIGQDFTIAGYELGKYIFDAMGGEGKYIIASCAPTDTALVEREAGVDEAAKEYDGKNKYIRITDIDDNSREFKQEDITSPDTDLYLFQKKKKLNIAEKK